MENTESIEKNRVYRLGTRGSLLAKMQSQGVADQLQQRCPGVQIELHLIKTTGDRVVDRPLNDIGGKGLFTKELEVALLSGEIDFAVHSYKDVPVTMPLVDVSSLVVAAVPKREDPRDVLVAGDICSIHDLPHASTVGTGSLRRQVQLLHHRPDLKVLPIRGNIDTRLRKQRDGEMDAIILAAAGLKRAGLYDSASMIEIPIELMVPAAAQGALALQCRAADHSTQQLLTLMNHPESQICINIEREVILLLNADCHSPIGVYATVHDQEVRVRIAIGKEGSARVETHQVTGNINLISDQIKSVLAR